MRSRSGPPCGRPWRERRRAGGSLDSCVPKCLGPQLPPLPNLCGRPQPHCGAPIIIYSLPPTSSHSPPWLPPKQLPPTEPRPTAAARSTDAHTAPFLCDTPHTYALPLLHSCLRLSCCSPCTENFTCLATCRAHTHVCLSVTPAFPGPCCLLLCLLSLPPPLRRPSLPGAQPEPPKRPL